MTKRLKLPRKVATYYQVDEVEFSLNVVFPEHGCTATRLGVVNPFGDPVWYTVDKTLPDKPVQGVCVKLTEKPLFKRHKIGNMQYSVHYQKSGLWVGYGRFFQFLKKKPNSMSHIQALRSINAALSDSKRNESNLVSRLVGDKVYVVINKIMNQTEDKYNISVATQSFCFYMEEQAMTRLELFMKIGSRILVAVCGQSNRLDQHKILYDRERVRCAANKDDEPRLLEPESTRSSWADETEDQQLIADRGADIHMNLDKVLKRAGYPSCARLHLGSHGADVLVTLSTGRHAQIKLGHTPRKSLLPFLVSKRDEFRKAIGWTAPKRKSYVPELDTSDRSRVKEHELFENPDDEWEEGQESDHDIYEVEDSYDSEDDYWCLHGFRYQ